MISEPNNIAACYRIHAYLLPYRQLEGFLRAISFHTKKFKKVVPDFTPIWQRVEKIKINPDQKVNLPKNDDIVIAVDRTSIKITNGEDNGYLTNGRIKEE